MVSTRRGLNLGSVVNPQGSEAYRIDYDQETTRASMAVVAALSEAMDVDPTELEPLHASVDADALDALVRVRGSANGEVQVTFEHEGREITVYSYGAVAVAPPEYERTDSQSTGTTHK